MSADHSIFACALFSFDDRISLPVNWLLSSRRSNGIFALQIAILCNIGELSFAVLAT